MSDPIQDAWAEARRARLAAQRAGDAPMPDENAEALAAVKEVQGERATSGLGAIGQAAKDVLRVASSSISDPLRAGLDTLTSDSDETFRQNLAWERAKTAKVKDQMGMAGDVANIAGDTALMAGYTPGAMVSTPLRALGTGALFGMGQDTLQHWEQTGELPPIEQEIQAAGRGALASGAGMLLGAGANWAIGKVLGTGAKIPQQLTRQLEKAEKIQAITSKKMTEADVKLHPDLMKVLLGRIERASARGLITQSGRPETWKALNVLRSRVAKGGEVSLLELNDIRRRIRDWDLRGKENYEGIKLINDNINKVINNLPSYVKPGLASGNVKEGVSAWNSLNRQHIQAEKMNAFVDITRNAEHLAAARGWSIERALMEQTDNYLKKNKNTKIFNNEEKEILAEIARGSTIGNALNKLDARLGHGVIRVAAGLGMAPARTLTDAAARNKLQMGVDSILYGSPAKAAAKAPFVGMATMGEMMRPDVGPTAGASPALPVQPLSEPAGESPLPAEGLGLQQLLPPGFRR